MSLDGKPAFPGLEFAKERITAKLLAPSGDMQEKPVEVRRDPVTGRTCRIALARAAEREPGAETLPPPPPDAQDTAACPFCRPQVTDRTPRLQPELFPEGRLDLGDSVLFPNLFPYGEYSAVNIFDNHHFVEMGTAELESYCNGFLNAERYLRRILAHDPRALHMAITQNHLPSAGGSLVHPHLQIQADRVPSNHQRFLRRRAQEYFERWGSRLFGDYLEHEKAEGSRIIGETGRWQWLAAFAPEGFFEIWGLLPGVFSLRRLEESDWRDLARGLLNAQRFYRSLCRNGYNFGLLLVEDGNQVLELRARVTVRSNYTPWARNDFTGFEVMLGDMATFIPPEETAKKAREFWPLDGKREL